MFDQKAYQQEYQPKWRARNPDHAKKRWASDTNQFWYKDYMKTEEYKDSKRRTRLKSRYGISQEQYNTMLEEQSGVCYLCGNPPKENDRLCVDHDADTKAVRKLLCRQCNVGLGNLKHNSELLRKAAIYLETF